MGGVSATEQVFLTYGAIGHVLASLAIVIIKQQSINAHSTVIAVPKIFSSSDSTKTAIGALVRGSFI